MKTCIKEQLRFKSGLHWGDPIISSTDQYIFSATGVLTGGNSLMSEGQDSFLRTIRRPVVGGTGIYRGMTGEVKVEVLGSNSTGFVNRRLTFQIRLPEEAAYEAIKTLDINVRSD
jgi:hypothetical protein